MPVTEKMSGEAERVYFDVYDQNMEGNEFASENMFDRMVQAAIDAAWTKFDPEDESTWPKGGHGEWLCLSGNGSLNLFFFHKDFPWSTTVSYCDPADLLPSSIGEDK